jgi:hypothetical protein
MSFQATVLSHSSHIAAVTSTSSPGIKKATSLAILPGRNICMKFCKNQLLGSKVER